MTVHLLPPSKQQDTTDDNYATVEDTEKQAYTCTSSIPMETNECYGTIAPSMDPDRLYATVEDKPDFTCDKQQQAINEYEYVIP